MPDLAGVLKDEIRRLARKEIKIHMADTRKLASRQRTEISALRRELRAQEKQLATLRKAPPTGAVAAAAALEDIPQTRFSPKWVRTHRGKLGVSQADYAALVGVSPLTIYNWETGKTRPRTAQLSRWADMRQKGKRELMVELEEIHSQ